MFGWIFPRAKHRAIKQQRYLNQEMLVNNSRDAVIDAARSTADVASEVTMILKHKLDEGLRQIEVTERLMNDALMTCSLSGEITSTNRGADLMFAAAGEFGLGAQITDFFVGFDGHPAKLWESFENGDTVLAKAGERTVRVKGSIAALTRYDGTPRILMIIHAIMDEGRPQLELDNYRNVFQSDIKQLMIVQDGKIMASNDAANLGFNAGDTVLVGEDFLSFFPFDRQKIMVIMEDRTKGAQFDTRYTYGGIDKLISLITSPIIWEKRPALLVVVRVAPTANATVAAARKSADMVRYFDSDFDMKSTRIEHTQQMLCQITKDFIIATANEAFASHYGYSSADVIGEDLRTIMAKNEKEAFAIHISAMTPEAPCRKMKFISERGGASITTIWIDVAGYDKNGNSSWYTRMGYCDGGIGSELLELVPEDYD